MSVPVLWLKLLFTLLAVIIAPPFVFALLAALVQAGKMVAKEAKTVLVGPTWKERGLALHRLLILVVVIPFIVATAAMLGRAISTAIGGKG